MTENNHYSAGEKNTTLYIIQILLAVGVVFIHLQYSLNGLEIYFEALGRSTVLFFFAVSGYFFYKNNINKSIKEMYKQAAVKILRLLLMALIVLLITFAYKVIFECKLDRTSVQNMLKNHFNFQHFLAFLLFNSISVANHTWFLYSLCYVYLSAPILVSLYKKIERRFTLLLGAILVLVFVYSFNTLFWNHIGSSIKYMITRNWLFEGIPAFSIGIFLRDHQGMAIKAVKNINRLHLAFLLLIICGAFFVDVFVSKAGDVYREFYLISPFLVMALLSVSLAYPSCKAGAIMLKLFGSKCSTVIYLFHPLVIQLTDKLLFRLLGDGNYYFLSFAITLAITLVMSMIYGRIERNRTSNCSLRQGV